MRYYLRKGIEIRSENSAKPDRQTSLFVEQQIRSMRPVESALNYGAGKLRFLPAMLQVSSRLTLLDSTIQMERRQRLVGALDVAYKDIIRGTNAIDMIDLAQLRKSTMAFDRIYCLNVLVVIPFPAIRRDIFVRSFRGLKNGGELVVVNRWRNSDFTLMKSRTDAVVYAGGTLVKSFRGHGYYYPMNEDEAAELARDAGFAPKSSVRKDGSYFSVFSKCV